MPEARRKFLPGLAAALLLQQGVAYAFDVPPPGRLGEDRVTVDASLETMSFRTGSLDVNVTLAPLGSIYASGLRVRLGAGRSWYDFLANDAEGRIARGFGFEGNLLVGYSITTTRLNLVGLIGVASSETTDQGLNRADHGAKAVMSVFARPTDRTMAYASFSHSTIRTTSQMQVKFGTTMANGLQVGPEANLVWRHNYPWNASTSSWRVGVHLSSMRLGPGYFGVSGGWLRDRDLGDGHYIGTSIYGSF